MFLKSEFQDDRSVNAGAVGVEICLFPLTRLIAYTTVCCYRADCDNSPIVSNEERSTHRRLSVGQCTTGQPRSEMIDRSRREH